MQVIDTFQNRLKLAMDIKHIKQVDLVERTKIDKTLINKYLAGITNAGQVKLTILADALNVNEIWLMGYDVPMERNLNTIVKSQDNNPAVVFVYGTIPAGIPLECIEDIIDTEEISADMLKGGKEYFALRIKGDSMEPEFLDGDTVIFRKQDDCENGDDCVVMINGYDGTFKRVFKNDNGIVLQPLNNKYPPMPYSNEQIENLPVKILGVYEELRRKNKRKNK